MSATPIADAIAAIFAAETEQLGGALRSYEAAEDTIERLRGANRMAEAIRWYLGTVDTAQALQHAVSEARSHRQGDEHVSRDTASSSSKS